ncbi:MAG: hypothetical protein B7X06_02530 [Verrucomicrobia bacterium 21-51-4]|nr:MAG: hypothetical protein B7X06_02530 [Verrucomicrobia bacterium 21-51-4]
MIAELKAGHPMVAKKRLAIELVGKFHGEAAAQTELEQFEKVFSKGEVPDSMPEFDWDAITQGASEAAVIDLLGASKLVASKNEIRRLVEQGAVKVDDNRVPDIHVKLQKPQTGASYVIQAGKRIWMRVR